MANGTDPVLEKIKGLKEAGAAAVQAGNVGTFSGFPPALAQRMNVSFLGDFTNDQLLTAIAKSAESHGIDVILAGLDFPLHATVLEADWNENLGDWCEICSFMSQEISLVADGYRHHKDLLFQHVILDGEGNCLLMADSIPTWLIGLRMDLATVYKAYNLQVRRMDDILHATLCRIRSYDGGDLSAFCCGIEKLEGETLFQCRRVRIGSALDLL
ncbi:MAG: hypothetical protein Q8R39_03375 [bacterium]|nr:hypothetical protein [bacterium]